MALMMLLVRLGGAPPVGARRAVATGGRTLGGLLLAVPRLPSSRGRRSGRSMVQVFRRCPGVSSMLNGIWTPIAALTAGRRLAERTLVAGSLPVRPGAFLGAYGEMELPARGIFHPRLVDFLPGCLSVQDPAPTLAILARPRRVHAYRRCRAQPIADSLACAAGGLSGAAIVVRFDVGSRHLLPAYARCSSWRGGGRLGRAQVGASRAARLRGVVARGELAGGVRSHGVFQRVGWWAGQGTACWSTARWSGAALPALERGWRNARIHAGLFAYFGYADLRRFRLDRVTRLPSFIDERDEVAPAPLRPRTYVISATLLHTLYGATPGPWTPSYELAYRSLRPAMRRLEADVAKGHRPTPDEAARYRRYDGLRFARWPSACGPANRMSASPIRPWYIR